MGVNSTVKIVEINPDVRSRVEENGGYCPCLIEKNADTKCMCKDFRESTVGTVCHCGRFRKEYASPMMPEVFEKASRDCKCTWDELNMKFAAKCKQYDELVAEIKKKEMAMCSYCNPSSDAVAVFKDDKSDKYYTECRVCDFVQLENAEDLTVRTFVNNCPWCGRKLVDIT